MVENNSVFVKSVIQFDRFPMERLITQLIEGGYLRTGRIIDAFRKVHRADFLPDRERQFAHRNEPLPIGYGQTISQPLTVALMLELLKPDAGETVLDIGAGSGWTTALFATIVGEKGRVIAIERIPQLFAFAQKNLKPYSFSNVTLILGDGAKGYAVASPYNCIHVAAAARHGIPDELKSQLAVNGRLVIPVGEPMQSLVSVTRTGRDAFEEQRIPGFSFVSLIEERKE